MSALEVEKGYHWNHRYNICDQIFFSLDNVWTALYELLNKFLQLKTLISRNVYSAAIINVFQSELSDFEINVPHCLKKYRNDESYTVWSREGHQGILVHLSQIFTTTAAWAEYSFTIMPFLLILCFSSKISAQKASYTLFFITKL